MSPRAEHEVRINGIPSRWVTDYVRASGDDNPLHHPAAGRAPIVQGMLLAALLERHAMEVYGRERLVEMAVRFTRPVFVDQPIILRLREGPTHQAAVGVVRKVRGLIEASGKLALVADCVFQLSDN